MLAADQVHNEGRHDRPSNQLPLDVLGAELRARIDKADLGLVKVEEEYLAIGLLLKEAKERVCADAAAHPLGQIRMGTRFR